MDDQTTHDDERPSKSRRKRDMHERQALGVRLAALSQAQLARLPLEEGLRDALLEAQRVSGHEARRRQMQYVGKLMRSADYEAIRLAFEDLTGDSRAAVVRMHASERLRDRLLDDDAALAQFLADHPGVDAQWLRTKVRAARQERTAAKPPRHARELYRWLHTLLAPSSVPAAPEAMP